MAGLTDISIGNFTKVYYNTGTTASPTWVEIERIQSLTHPTDEKNIVEVPRYGSVYPTKLAGSASTGNAEIVVNFNPDNSTHQYLLASYKNSSSEEFKIEVNEDIDGTNGSYFRFAGQVASKTSSGEFDSITTMTFSLSVNGAIGDWTPNA